MDTGFLAVGVDIGKLNNLHLLELLVADNHLLVRNPPRNEFSARRLCVGAVVAPKVCKKRQERLGEPQTQTNISTHKTIHAYKEIWTYGW